jgi:hypothetical protein
LPQGVDPAPRDASQCIITLREDFVEVEGDGKPLWLSKLYLKLAGVEKEHSTLLGVSGSDVYVTDMAFVGDKVKARAIDLKGLRKLYVASADLLSHNRRRQTGNCGTHASVW